MIKTTPAVAVTSAFACKLLARLAASADAANIFISPTSIALALAIVYNGARGATRRAIADALDLGDIDADELNSASAELAHQLGQLDRHVQLAIANSLWLSEEFQLADDFARTARGCYDATVRRLDFKHEPVARIINAWVAEQTHDKIERIVEQIDRDTVLLLINAIYFKGSWTEPFSRQLTREAPFTLPGGRQVQCQQMSQRGKYRYFEDQGVQAVSLPYGGGRICMYIFLPRAAAGLPELLRALSGKRWDAWMQRFSLTEGRVALPRFRLAYEAKLNDTLRALGMGIAFEPRADFGAMAEDGERLRIDEVRHKAFVEVNEEGAEAAAATSVGMMRASFSPAKTFNLVVDRPFLCAIRDDRTGAILFMGAINDPS